MHDLGNVAAKVWMLGMLCFAWGVGVSRCAPAALRCCARLGRARGRQVAVHCPCRPHSLRCRRRFIDNQHNISDILGGMLLGTMIALVYIMRAIPRYKRVLSPDTPALPLTAGDTPGQA